jgi:hypothetical protein
VRQPGRYPQLGVVFDGFSIPADHSEASEKVEHASIIDEENAGVDAVRRKIRDHNIQIVIFNIIGRTISDAIQHKVGWFANKRGIIHSNLNMLGSTFFKMRCRNSTSRGSSRPAEKLVWRSVALELKRRDRYRRGGD